MSRESSPCIFGDYWLDKRRDGKSPDIWQIASYKPLTRSISYRSTKCECLETAKSRIRAYDAEQRAKGPQPLDAAKVIPLLILFWNEHGKTVVSPGQIASSIRCFIGFLMQDEATADLTVAQATPQVFERFRKWRMGPHEYDVPWGGESYQHTSAGVRGESVQRNLEDIRAALNHHVGCGRLLNSPKIPAVPKGMRSQPKDLVLTIDQLGAIIGFARDDIAMLRFLSLILATTARTEAAAAFDPKLQWLETIGVVDLHPPAWVRTKKHNPIVPLIEEMEPLMRAWKSSNAPTVKSKKTAWRTLRRALDLPEKSDPKSIRHTVATILRTRRVPFEEIETLLGHRVMKKTSAVYAKYDPDYLAEVRGPLSTLFRQVMSAADQWAAGHLRAKVGNGKTVVLRRNSQKAAEYLARLNNAGA